MAHPYSTASTLRKALKHLSLSSISLIIAILLGFCSAAVAQRFAATVQRYGSADGLAHREVNAIL